MERQEFRCTTCGQSFNSTDELSKHNKQYHRDLQNEPRSGTMPPRRGDSTEYKTADSPDEGSDQTE
jgi:hypothetical protein